MKQMKYFNEISENKNFFNEASMRIFIFTENHRENSTSKKTMPRIEDLDTDGKACSLLKLT